MVDPPYEITSDGNIFVQSSALITRAAPPSVSNANKFQKNAVNYLYSLILQTLTVRAININSQSENRQSDPVTVSVAYIEGNHSDLFPWFFFSYTYLIMLSARDWHCRYISIPQS